MKRLIVLPVMAALFLSACLPNCEESARSVGLSDQVRYPLIGAERVSELRGGGSWSFFGGGFSVESSFALLVTLRLSDRAALVSFPVSTVEFVFDGSYPPEVQFQWRAVEADACHLYSWSSTMAQVLEQLLDCGGKVTVYLTEEVYGSQVQPLLVGEKPRG